MRALASATRTRDYFPSDLPTDTFNVDNLTISRGPNAVLAGIGNAGGVIDSSMRMREAITSGGDARRWISSAICGWISSSTPKALATRPAKYQSVM